MSFRRRVFTLGVTSTVGWKCGGEAVEDARNQLSPVLNGPQKTGSGQLDGRTTRHAGYRTSQRKRKRIEEIFGWLKTVGGLRKSRFIGQAKTQMVAYLSPAAYNLLRISKLLAAPTG